MRRKIFVFGSNLAGRHGAGSALEAVKNYGAIYGRGVGLQGSSYAIPTKGRSLGRMTLEQIKYHVDNFLQFAKEHEELYFEVVSIGCGLAGYRVEQIAPMFRDHPLNVQLTKEFDEYLKK